MNHQSDSPTALPEAVIQQVNLSYNAEQDRILMRIGLSDDSELMMWLTYRLTKKIWALLNTEVHFPRAESMSVQASPQEAVAQFVQEAQTSEVLKKLDFATQYQARKEIRSDGIMLATQVELNGDTSKRLDFTCLDGTGCCINLNQELIVALCNMLQLTAKDATWEIGAPPPVAAIADTTAPKVLH